MLPVVYKSEFNNDDSFCFLPLLISSTLRWYASSRGSSNALRIGRLSRFRYNKPVLFYIVTGEENKKDGPQTMWITHLCFQRPSETTSKAMKKLVEIEIQATQVRNCLALKSFRDVLSSKSHIKCSQSDIASGLNSFETDKKCLPLHKIITAKLVHHGTGRECNKWGTE